MNRDIGAFITPVVAILIFALIALDTAGALRASGAWGGGRRHRVAVAREADPLAPVAELLTRPLPQLGGPVRDPFALGGAPAPAIAARVVARAPVVPAAPPQPLLTAIVWDADPRAIVRWQGRDLTVRAGGLFDDFQVTEITRDHVTLSRGTETIVLHRKPQGD